MTNKSLRYSKKGDVFKERITALLKVLAGKGLDGCVIEDKVDLLYFTGLNLSAGRLWVIQGATCLVVDSRYSEAALAFPFKVLDVHDLAGQKKLVRTLAGKSLAFDGSTLTVQSLMGVKKVLPSKVSALSIPGITMDVRMIKDVSEQKSLKESAKLLKTAFIKLTKLIRTGITEKELAKHFELILRELGADSAAFDPIIAFGPRTSMPHYRPDHHSLKEGEGILFDLGVVVDGYHSDMTRMVFHGKPSDQHFYLVEVVRKAHLAAIALCRPGVLVKDLDIAARAVMRFYGLEALFTHGLGHGVGLEIHEGPRIRFDSKDKDLPLQEGMVITIEPGLYLPGVCGARHEDMVLITKGGCQILTEGV